VKLIALGLLGVVLLSGMALAAAPLSDEDCVKMGAVVRSIGSLRDKGISKADAMALSSRYSSEKVKHLWRMVVSTVYLHPDWTPREMEAAMIASCMRYENQ
jgi:hypothetical protein